MRKVRLAKVTIAGALSLCAVFTTAVASANEGPPAPRGPAAENGGRDKDRAESAVNSSRAIRDEYIVTVKPGNDPDQVAGAVGARPRFTYRSAINGFAAHLNEGQVNALRHRPDVELVESDQLGGAATTQYMSWSTGGQPWGLDRIDQATGLSWSYSYNGQGTGVRAYVIDSGLQANHPEFGSRALNVYDALGGNGADCNGHGTHVAGTIGGATYGVAKAVYLRGVRVLDCYAGGSASQAIAGVDWVRANSVRPAVASLSVRYPYSSALNAAVYNLAESGVFVAAAAGNENDDACNFSPASAYGAFTTAASDRSDKRASFSNHGGCVDGYAPGVDIKSAWIGSGTNTLSATSFATPHVTGTAALYKGNFGDVAWSTIYNWLWNNSTPNVIVNNVGTTPNRLLYKAAL